MLTTETPDELFDVFLTQEAPLSRKQVRTLAKKHLAEERLRKGDYVSREVVMMPSHHEGFETYLDPHVQQALRQFKEVIANILREDDIRTHIVRSQINADAYDSKHYRLSAGARLKIRPTAGIENLPHPYPKKLPRHPNLAVETTYYSSAEHHLVTHTEEIKHFGELHQFYQGITSPDSKLNTDKILLDAMIACSALHKNGFSHLDIKPENILMTLEDEKAQGKLIDCEFSINRKYGGAKPTHNTDKIICTPQYHPNYYHVEWTHMPYWRIDVFAFAIIWIEHLLEKPHTLWKLVEDDGIPYMEAVYDVIYQLEQRKTPPEIINQIEAALDVTTSSNPTLDTMIDAIAPHYGFARGVVDKHELIIPESEKDKNAPRGFTPGGMAFMMQA